MLFLCVCVCDQLIIVRKGVILSISLNSTSVNSSVWVWTGCLSGTWGAEKIFTINHTSNKLFPSGTTRKVQGPQQDLWYEFFYFDMIFRVNQYIEFQTRNNTWLLESSNNEITHILRNSNFEVFYSYVDQWIFAHHNSLRFSFHNSRFCETAIVVD